MKGYPTAIQAVLKGRIVAIRKGNKHQLGLFSCLKHAKEMLLGDPWQTDHRTQSFHFPIVIHQSLDPAARALKRQAILVFTFTQALDRLRTRRRVGSTRCRGNHMHDHSRFQRDIDDVTGVSLSLSLSPPLTKVTHAQ